MENGVLSSCISRLLMLEEASMPRPITHLGSPDVRVWPGDLHQLLWGWLTELITAEEHHVGV